MILNLAISTSYAINFLDLEVSHWAYKDIMLLANQGIINGYEDGTYMPEQAVTRGEFLKLIMVALYEGNEYFEVNNFKMVHWAMPYAIEAAESGYLMNGTSIADLNNYISRKEMVNILAKICIQNKIQKNEYGGIIQFSDIDFYLSELNTAIQVAYSIDEKDAYDREVNNLIAFAKANQSKSNLIIITYEEEKIIEVDGFLINVVPLKKFLLN